MKEERVRFGCALGGLALAAASTGTAVPALKRLAAEAQLSTSGAGLFVACHVAGTLLGAWALGRLSRLGGEPRSWRAVLVLAALASALANLALTQAAGVAAVSTLRLADGMVHIVVVTVLMSLGVSADANTRRRQTAWLGGLLVTGVGAGMALGGAVAGDHPRRAFLVGSALALGSAVVGWRAVEANAHRAVALRRPQGLVAPTAQVALSGLVVGAERFAMGVLTVFLPFAAGAPRRVGALLGTLVIASLLIGPAANALSARRGPRWVWTLGGVTLALALSALAFSDLLSSRLGFAWAVATGAGAGLMFFGALAHVSGLPEEAMRVRGMGFVHALGGAGFLCGSLVSGFILSPSAGAAWGVPLTTVLVLCAALAALARVRPARTATAGPR